MISQFSFPIIAADGAANSLINHNINPDFVVGDLDSADIDLAQNVGSKIVKLLNQDHTDFEKCIQYALTFDLYPALVFGVDGNFFDHALNNLSIIVQTELIFITKDIIGICSNKCKTYTLPYNTKISIFGAPKCKISTNGLKWNLKSSYLNFFESNSCSNRSVEQQVNIDIHYGKALIMIHLSDILDMGATCKY